ncbi:AAA family ATPase [Plantactinospora solaniradicis]|uniref:AAA family ATPase n=1 Tax=Plantactinospora solaniradicis TaxID=1723736 RepID=A0ABW1K214_9ACTN
MPRLILLNGPPACGKSTLAQRYVDEHPLALNLDIDCVRRLLGRWREDAYAAGLLARAIALAAARTHVAASYDVVIPQLVADLKFVEEIERVARDVGAEFHEVVLLDGRENALRRFEKRTRTAAEPAHVEAGELLDRPGGLDELAAMYDRLMRVVAARPMTRVLPSVEGEVEQTYQRLLGLIQSSA